MGSDPGVVWQVGFLLALHLKDTLHIVLWVSSVACLHSMTMPVSTQALLWASSWFTSGLKFIFWAWICMTLAWGPR